MTRQEGKAITQKDCHQKSETITSTSPHRSGNTIRGRGGGPARALSGIEQIEIHRAAVTASV